MVFVSTVALTLRVFNVSIKKKICFTISPVSCIHSESSQVQTCDPFQQFFFLECLHYQLNYQPLLQP